MFLQLCWLRELAAQDEEEDDDEGIACEETPDTVDVAEAPKVEDEDGKEEDDELAEYGLDRYDEEDVGESGVV